MEFSNKKYLVMGVANELSLAWSVAKLLKASGAMVAVTYGQPSLERRVVKMAENIGIDAIFGCDVAIDQEIETLFTKVEDQFGNLDGLVHSIAFAQTADLENPFTETSRHGFLMAMDISVYSFIRSCQKAKRLLAQNGGSILTMTNNGSQRVIPNYNIMGVAKAALEASVRYLASELGTHKIRVNAISAGPVKTLSASAIKDFKSLLAMVENQSPLKENITGDDVAQMALFLLSANSKHITGGVHLVDSGISILGA